MVQWGTIKLIWEKVIGMCGSGGLAITEALNWSDLTVTVSSRPLHTEGRAEKNECSLSPIEKEEERIELSQTL